MVESQSSIEVGTFAGGCFWCTEASFKRVEGVLRVTPGYMGGDLADPTNSQVKTGTSGHAEVVQVEYDTSVVSYSILLDWFFKIHDPTTLNRQGKSVGTQYRSAIFFYNSSQQEVAESVKSKWQTNFESPIVTEIVPATDFYPAEAEHQSFYERNPEHPNSIEIIAPKLYKLGL